MSKNKKLKKFIVGCKIKSIVCVYDWDYPPINHSPTPDGETISHTRPTFFNSFSKGILFLTDTDILAMAKANRYINTKPILDCIPYRMDIALLIS